MARLGLGVFLGAVAMFFWGFAFWGSGLFDPFAHVKDLNSEQVIVEALKPNLPAHGTYMLPDMKIGTMEEQGVRQGAGPLVQIHYFPSGITMGDPVVMGFGFLHMLVTVAIFAGVLWLVSAAVPAYMDRLKLVAAIALMATIFANFGNPIWFHHDWGFAAMVGVYDFFAYLISGAVLSYFVTR